MTDEELIARLRGKNCCESQNCNCDAAADRIEALVKQVDTMLTPEEAEKLVEMADPILSELLAVEASCRKEAEARAERLEAALHRIQEGRYGRAAAIARTALKGDDHE